MLDVLLIGLSMGSILLLAALGLAGGPAHMPSAINADAALAARAALGKKNGKR